MKLKNFTFIFIWFLGACFAQPISGKTPSIQSPPSEYQISVSNIIASGFQSPLQITNAADGSGRLFVVEQTGKIKIIKGGSVLAQPFLDITPKISCCGERGLLGLAFHPNFKTNGYFYIDYTDINGNTVIGRYKVSGDPDQAEPGSFVQLLTVTQPYSNHNGGQLLFGPDGYLYIGMGDGGSGGDPQNNAQNIESLLGKMLRIDVDAGSPYAIPASNPFVGKAGRDEIWSLGLRNPWRFSFDRVTGDLYIADVGQNLWEEIDFQPYSSNGGVNYGWRCMEGTHAYSTVAPCNSASFLAGLIAPILDYSHTADGQSVSGGFVYRGVLFPALEGNYFYGDYVTGKIWSVKKISSIPLSFSSPKLEIDTDFNISSFGEDENGEIYITDYANGAIRKLEDANGPLPNLSTSRKFADKVAANQNDLINYTIELVNKGGKVDSGHVSDILPASVQYQSGSLSATSGVASISDNEILWDGEILSNSTVSITYQVRVNTSDEGSVVNFATISGTGFQTFQVATSVQVPVSVLQTTKNNFFLPGTQPGELNVALKDSVDCNTCHSEPIYDHWRGSVMSQAGRDPIFWSALNVANAYAPNSGEYCLRCHSPSGWLDNRSDPADGTGLLSSDISNGVPCQLCHRMVDPAPITTPSGEDEAKIIDDQIRQNIENLPPASNNGSAMAVIDPADNRRGPFSLGATFNYHTAYQTDLLGQDVNAVTEAKVCGTCHNLDNPMLSWNETRGEYWPNVADEPAQSFEKNDLFPIERTYDEWQYSDFAKPEGVYDPRFAGDKSDGIVRTCQDCHMPRTTGAAADAAFNPMERDCAINGCLPDHTFNGANTWLQTLLLDQDWRLNATSNQDLLQVNQQQTTSFLKKAASINLTVAPVDGNQIATVRVTNNTGHKLPTGYPEGRRMWVNLKAYDVNYQLVYESGAYDFSSGSLNEADFVKIYEVKQGLSDDLAQELNLPAGPSFFFALNNIVVKDNRIPPRGYLQSTYDQPGLRPVGTVYKDGQYWDETEYSLPNEAVFIRATLYYQTSSKEYVDFLAQYGGVDGVEMSRLWQESKSPPVVMASVWFPNYPVFMPAVVR